ncbi:MAG: hypothetical protein HDT01_02495 [Bacteroidales bacterium]|nr:hypothetical protein [Bacteroidales bacterium]
MAKENYPTHGMDLNENGEWVEAPLEDIIPAWLHESLDNDDKDIELAMVEPYLQNEFKDWLINKRGISEKSADEYLRAYRSAYEALHKKIDIDLYSLLHSFLVEIPEKTKCDLTKAEAPGLVLIYVDEMLKAFERKEKAFENIDLRVLTTYHAFITEISESSDKTFIKKKSVALPDEGEFLEWLENECRIKFENAKKIVSSVKRMDLIMPSLVSDPMTFLDVLRAIPNKEKREKYIKLVCKDKEAIYRNAGCSYKTLKNGFTNIDYYLKFINSKPIFKHDN